MALERKCTAQLFHRWLAAISAGVLFTVPVSYSQAAENAEQLVFSGVGTIDGDGAFGFWVWCQVEPASENSAYDNDCNGAMYFYDLGVVEHVTGFVTEAEVPGLGDIYIMDLSAPKGSLFCELENEAPIAHGPKNTVLATCTVNGQDLTGTSETAVVNATGPE